MNEPAIEELKLKLREFAQVRSELLEHFQWMTEKDSYELAPQRQAAVAFEMADIFIFLLRLSDQLNIDLVDMTRRKMEINEKRYPVEKVKGSSKKYSEYDKA